MNIILNAITYNITLLSCVTFGTLIALDIADDYLRTNNPF